MPEKIYSFNGKDITMNVCIQIRAVVKLLQERFHIAFEEAVVLFYKSETYKTLQETENGLWAESAESITSIMYVINMEKRNGNDKRVFAQAYGNCCIRNSLG